MATIDKLLEGVTDMNFVRTKLMKDLVNKYGLAGAYESWEKFYQEKQSYRNVTENYNELMIEKFKEVYQNVCDKLDKL